MDAFVMGELHRDKRQKVFDWDKAAQLIKQSKATYVSAGLRDDWTWTGGNIYKDGKPNLEDYTYLSSTWAIPEIELDGVVQECWKWQDETEWDFDTKWPKSALKILES